MNQIKKGLNTSEKHVMNYFNWITDQSNQLFLKNAEATNHRKRSFKLDKLVADLLKDLHRYSLQTKI